MMLGLFEDELIAAEREQERIEAEREAERQRRTEQARQPRQCTVCGEWSQNEYLWSINHRDDLIAAYGGLCIRRFYALPPAERYKDWGPK